MTVRIFALSALALAFVVGGFAAMWVGIGFILSPGPTSVLEEDLQAWMWLQLLAEAGAPMVGAGLITGSGALALIVRGRQVAAAQAGSASATVSRETARS